MKKIKLRKRVDQRGFLIENTNEDIFDGVKHFFIAVSKKGAVRGNHYHLEKTEWFLVIKGTCEVLIKDIDTGKGKKLIIKDSDNIMINIEPNKAHAFKNIGKEEMIILALVNESFNCDIPDTFDYLLTKSQL